MQNIIYIYMCVCVCKDETMRIGKKKNETMCKENNILIIFY